MIDLLAPEEFIANGTPRQAVCNLNYSPRWYAVRTRPRHEKVVRDWMESRSIVSFLPTVMQLSTQKDRKKTIEVPLFSGYCFAQFQWDDKGAVLKVPGVVQIVEGVGRPEPIPDEEIDGLRKLMQSSLNYSSHPYLQAGMLMEVIRGPLKGMRGVLLHKDKPHRLVIAVHLIRQAAAVELDASSVVPI